MWNSLDTIPRDGRRIDVWCVSPEVSTVGVRFTDIQMRGDGSGFGHVIDTERGVTWDYLERDGGIYPKWIITHWMERPEGPK